MAYIQIIPHRARPFDDRAGHLPLPATKPWSALDTLLVVVAVAGAIALVGAFLPPSSTVSGPKPEEAQSLIRESQAIHAHNLKIQAEITALRHEAEARGAR